MLKEYMDEKNATKLQKDFAENLKSYKEKDETVSDQEWLKVLIQKRCCNMTEEHAEKEAAEIIESLNLYERNLKSLRGAAEKGISKEKWLEKQVQESAIGMSAVEYSESLQNLDRVLFEKNAELASALERSTDGHVMMSRNLDGNIAEQMLAKTTEAAGFLQNKNIKVEVRGVNTANSVDVRATNLTTGEYQNYQMKFGSDAKSTIRLLEEGNYNNQRLIVPKEQLQEVQEHFIQKGSSKTISDHIEIDGVKGKSFTKEEMKQLQRQAQEDGIMPTLDDYYYSSKEYAMSVAKNAGVMALQVAAVTTGFDIVAKVCQGKEIKADELVEDALKTGTDTGIKVVAAGTLYTGVRNGVIPFLSKSLSANAITNIAFVGIENLKVLGKVATGKLSMLKGLDAMGQVTTSMAGGLWAISLVKGAIEGAALGGPFGVAVGLVGGMVSYAAGSTAGNKIYNTVKKVAKTAKETGRKIFNELKAGVEKLKNKARSFLFA